MMTTVNLCPSCGLKLTTMDIYCPNCGFLNKSSVIQSQITPTKSGFFSLIAFGWGMLFTIIYRLTIFITSLLNPLYSINFLYISFFLIWLAFLIILYLFTKKLTDTFPHLKNKYYIKKNTFSIIVGSSLLYIIFFLLGIYQNIYLGPLVPGLTSFFNLSITSVLAYLGILFLIEYPENLSSMNFIKSPKFVSIVRIPFITGVITEIIFLSATVLLFYSIQIAGSSIYQSVPPFLTVLVTLNSPLVIYFLFKNKKLDLFQSNKTIFLMVNLSVIVIVETLIFFPSLVIISIIYSYSFNTDYWFLYFTESLSTALFTLIGTMAGLFILNYYKK